MPFKASPNGLSLFPDWLKVPAPGSARFGVLGWSARAGRDARMRKRRSTYICRIDVMGMAAIFFVLLLLFMANTQPFHHLSVDLFSARTANLIPAALREDAMHILVERDGTIYFDNARVRPNDLPRKIRESVDSGSERRVYIYADKRGHYGDVRIVLEKLQAAEIEHVTFLTQTVQP